MYSGVPSCLNSTAVYVVVTTFVLIVLYRYRRDAKTVFFVFVYGNIVSPLLVFFLHPLKKDHFSVLRTLESHDPKLKKLNALRILEVGTGPGINLQYYPKGTRLISVEPNSKFEDYLAKNLKKCQHVRLEKCFRGKAEDMAEIEDGSVDVVVTSYVLCYVRDFRGVFKEIQRVLAPGGRYLYFEHVSFPRGSFGRVFQKTIQPLWDLVSDGCQLTNDTSTFIRDAGFSSVDEKLIYGPIITYPGRPLIIGTAFK